MNTVLIASKQKLRKEFDEFNDFEIIDNWEKNLRFIKSIRTQLEKMDIEVIEGDNVKEQYEVNCDKIIKVGLEYNRLMDAQMARNSKNEDYKAFEIIKMNMAIRKMQELDGYYFYLLHEV